MSGRTLHRRLLDFGLAIPLVLSLVLAIAPLSAKASVAISTADESASLLAYSGASTNVRVILQGQDAKKLADLAAKHGGRVIRDLQIGGAVAVELPAAEVKALKRAGVVKRISRDVRVVSHTRPEDVINPAKMAGVYPWAVMAPQLWRGEKSITGRGVGVAVVDSGIAANRDFEGSSGGQRIIASFSPTSSNVQVDVVGHGTAVAGVIGGNGALGQGKYVGVAPEVNLINLKVGDDSGVAYVSDVMAAIKWAVENRKQYNIRVLNIALTSTVEESYRTSLLSFAVEYAWSSGIVVVVAAGNCEGGDACRKLYPPANDPFVITVGATDDRGSKESSDDTLASFSVFGRTGDGFSKPEVAAPGRHLTTVLSSSGNALAQANPSRIVDGQYIRLSGTSLAAGVVSGVVAQLLQDNPSLRPAEVKWLLGRTAQAVGRGGIAGTGAGYPQAQRAAAYGGPRELADRGLVANNYIALAIAKALGLKWDGVSWDGVSWDGVSWDGVSWDGVSWDGVSWDGVSWDGVSWDGVSWDGVSWDSTSFD